MTMNGAVAVPRERPSALSAAYVVIGVVLAIGAIVSAIQISEGLSVAAPLSGALEAYRSAAHPVAEAMLAAIRGWFPLWQPPAYEADIYVLSFAAAFLGLGLLGLPRVRGVVSAIVSLLVVLAIGATFVGLIPVLWLLFDNAMAFEDWRDRRVMVFFSPIAFAALFLAANVLL